MGRERYHNHCFLRRGPADHDNSGAQRDLDILWILISLFFLWCAFREIRAGIVAPSGYDFPVPISKSYLALVLLLAALFGWPTIRTWSFQRFLTSRATALAEPHRAKVHCNTIFDTMVDSEMLASGHANIETGEIALQHPWCGTLMSYLRHPARASHDELFALDMFTHESMHVRGERNEAVTECQAIQRNYRAAKLLGVPDRIAKQNALDYYNVNYQERRIIGGMQAAYYSAECAPGKALDEHLYDSTWATP